MKNHFENLKKLKAFTLIEMLLVLLIISITNINYSKHCKTNTHIQSTGCEAQVKMINSQIEAYTLKHNRTPSNINDLINDGLIKKDKNNADQEKQLQYLMVRLLRTSKINAFTLLETLLTLLILIIIMISPSIYTKTKLDLIESELKVKNLSPN